MKFEVLINEQFVVLKNGTSSVWWPRLPTTDIKQTDDSSVCLVNPEFKIQDGDNSVFESFTCHGIVYGFVGLFNNDKLILIKESVSIGRLPFASHDEVFKIQKICVIPLRGKNDLPFDLDLDSCGLDSCTKPVTPTNNVFVQATFKDSLMDESSVKLNTFLTHSNSLKPSRSVQRTWNQIKMTASNVKPRVSSIITNVNNQQSNKEDRDKFDRRLIEDVCKMFNDTHSFYYSWAGDLTNSVQRQQKIKQNIELVATDQNDIRTIPLWKRVDDRFFWNKYMLQSLSDIFDNSNPNKKQILNEKQIKCYSHIWILPIIQGFIQIEKCCFDLSENSPVAAMNSFLKESSNNQFDKTNNCDKKIVESFLETRDYYWMALISRRSRFRAGTRYKKRGLDENGTCANYVETEQIFSYGDHTVSFVCVRGSVPLFWSQPGYKYRPPPLMERSENENQEAFRKHFETEFKYYDNSVVAISLIEHTGREKVLKDSYKHHVVKFDDQRLTYVTFDFHDYCRGMKFENVSILIEKIYDLIKEMRYCWMDNDGVICEQRGVFRINCVDCLDRTNIVMTAIAKTVMDIQLVRLGLLPPEGQLSANSRRVFQLMWARNGDTISRQYAGTAALKGDYTRTGERKIAGVVRDGYNSANRYYLNRFKDAYRQAVIDIMQGNPVSDNLQSPMNDTSPKKTSNLLMNNDQEYHERIKMVIDDCKKILVPENEVILGGWPLVDADPITGSQVSSSRTNNEVPECEMDIVLILTKDCYYVADYDDQTDRIIKYQKVLLEDMEKIEIGAEPNYQSGPFSSIRNQNNTFSYAVRFHYTIGNQTGYFHMFRSTNTRFFNNMAIPIRTREEALESLKAICESFKVALSVKFLNVPFLEVSRLERRNSKRIFASTFKTDNNESFNRIKNIPNDNSYVSNSKKLFTGVYSHFSKLRGKLTGTIAEQQVANRQNLQLDGLKVRPNNEMEQKYLEVLDYESDDDDSIAKIEKKHHFANERALSSDGSEFGSEQILPPINEICSPCLDDQPMYSKEQMDRVLESCGILVTSPPLRCTSSSDNEYESPNITPKPQNENLPGDRMKSVLHDVDDFVIDSMKKASLKQILRKAVSQSQVSLTSGDNEKNVSTINKENNNNSNKTADNTRSPRQSNKCIYNSDLALNSIVSQPIKSDLMERFNSNDSLDATDSSIICSSMNLLNKDNITYPLISSSSFAALSFTDEPEFKSLGNECTPTTNTYKSYANNTVDNYSNGVGNYLLSGSFIKETSLSFSDIAFTTQNTGLKTSRSSNTLQVSPDFASLNILPASSMANVSEDNDGNSSAKVGSNFSSILAVKKDLVLSPLTRITKGIQTLTALNFDNSSQADTNVNSNFGSMEKAAAATVSTTVAGQQPNTRSHIIEI